VHQKWKHGLRCKMKHDLPNKTNETAGFTMVSVLAEVLWVGLDCRCHCFGGVWAFWHGFVLVLALKLA